MSHLPLSFTGGLAGSWPGHGAARDGSIVGSGFACSTIPPHDLKSLDASMLRELPAVISGSDGGGEEEEDQGRPFR